jgi:hypothetical protein
MAFIISAYSICWPTIINIPVDYPTIQNGIDASVNGDTVLVQPGIYVENINFNGRNIVLGSMFLITADTTYIEQTVIDGDSTGSVVTFENGEDAAAVITGFVVQNGFSTSGGGGISCINSAPTISYNHIKENLAIGSHMVDGTGGGIYCLESDATINHNIISGNVAIGFWTYGYGGGIYCFNSNAIIKNNLLFDNHAGGEWGYGGGISMLFSSPDIRNNVIISNSTLHWGGGIYCYESSPVMINNTLSANSAEEGGGIYCEWNSNPVIKNTILWANKAESSLEILTDSYSTPIITYCDIRDTLWPGDGNIDVDPIFRDRLNDDFHLMSVICGDSTDSPCIDTGDPEILDSSLGCDRGLGEYRSDMGAYGGGDSIMVGISGDISSIPDNFILLNNYPNPFNARATIEFTLAAPGDMELSIYDITGAKVETIRRPGLEAGRHSIVWESGKAASGVYFARMEVGGFSESIKMVLLK